MFLLFPDVEIAINKSPFLPIASICLEKICSNPKSLAIAVKLDVLDDKDIEYIKFCYNDNLAKNDSTNTNENIENITCCFSVYSYIMAVFYGDSFTSLSARRQGCRSTARLQ